MRTKLLLVAGFGAAAVALSACGTNTISGSATVGGPDAPTARGAAQISSVADLGSLVEHNASKKTSTHVDMNMTISGVGGLTANGDFKFAGTDSAANMTMSIPSVGELDMILVDHVIYMKLPAQLTQSPKPWVKVDLTGNDPLSQSFASSANLADESDPTQIIDKFKSSGSIDKVTRETLNGQPVTHYSITVDVHKLANSTGVDDTEKQALDRLGVTTMPFDVWMNSDNLPVKVVMHIAVNNPQTNEAGQADMTALYSNWGESVNVIPPPADQVGTLGGN